VLGKGSFGQVLKVLDYKTGSYKALKIIRNKKRFHHQVSPDRSGCIHASQQVFSGRSCNKRVQVAETVTWQLPACRC